jgi:hypothetical protein
MHTERKGSRHGKGGRPPKWTPEVALRLGEALGRGCWPWDAARQANIGKSTLHRWLRAGLAGDPRFVPLVEVLDRACKRHPWSW